MPEWLQTLTMGNPLRHFIVIVKGVFLKDMGAAAVWPSIWPLMIITVVTLTAANVALRRRLG